MKLDLGCGPAKKEGWYGVDSREFPGIDLVLDLQQPWPWADESVEEARSSHFVEHLASAGRCHFWNELWRVLAPGGKVEIVVPYWGSGRAYGDPTHQWPPISDMTFFYLDKEWRAANAPHCEGLLVCNFSATWGYGLHPTLATRNAEFQQFAVSYYREAITDIVATLVKKGPPRSSKTHSRTTRSR